MIKSFLVSFIITLSAIFTLHNLNQYNRGFDNCERLVAETQQNLETYRKELNELETMIYGSR